MENQIGKTQLQNSSIYCDIVFNIAHWTTEQQYMLWHSI